MSIMNVANILSVSITTRWNFSDFLKNEYCLKAVAKSKTTANEIRRLLKLEDAFDN